MTQIKLSDAMIEQAAKAAYEAEYDAGDYPWDAVKPHVKQALLSYQKAALEAALSTLQGREAALEEAAQIAETSYEWMSRGAKAPSLSDYIAHRIRALKSATDDA